MQGVVRQDHQERFCTNTFVNIPLLLSLSKDARLGVAERACKRKQIMMTMMLVRMAFRAIRHHVIRSLLTLLGIVIGIAGIIAIAAIGKGAQKKARDQFLAYGSKTVAITCGNWMSASKKEAKQFVLDDMNAIIAQCPGVRYITPDQTAHSIEIEYGGNTTKVEVHGGNHVVFAIKDYEVASGMLFNLQHVERRENVVVIKGDVAQALFGNADPIGHVIRIGTGVDTKSNYKPFIVIGVLAPPKKKGKWDGLGLSDVFIPFTTHQKYYGNRLRSFEMSTHTDEDVPAVTRQLEKIFRAAHRLEEGESNDFMIWDFQQFAVEAEKAAQSVGLFAIIAAIIALLVGGIGVMNIMLVAVQERTKEIGIKMALGATMRIIRMQFLLEAVMICMMGGVIGVLGGVGTVMVIEKFFAISAILELMPVIVSFFFTVVVGLLFGFYPAERAARMRPVEALADN